MPHGAFRATVRVVANLTVEVSDMERHPLSLSDPATERPGTESEASVRLSLEDVRFQYEDASPVLDGISVEVGAGETIGIVGPSGCGKSTLLSLVAGLHAPTGGRISRHAADAHRHPLSMVFQQDTLLPWLSVRDNVRFFSRFKRHGLRGTWRSKLSLGRRESSLDTERESLERRVDELLTVGGLSDAAHRYPYQLSGGMRRRVAFLAAVAPNPEILLLDEPFSSVDEPTRVGIHEDAFRITRMMNITTLLVTHDLAEAITLSDRVVILSNRPAAISRVYDLPFGSDREMLAIRETDEYLEIYRRLWHDLSAEISAGSRTHRGAGHLTAADGATG